MTMHNLTDAEIQRMRCVHDKMTHAMQTGEHYLIASDMWRSWEEECALVGIPAGRSFFLLGCMLARKRASGVASNNPARN